MKKIITLATLITLISCGSNSVTESKNGTTDFDSLEQVISIVDTTKVDMISGATNAANGLMLNGTMTIPPQNNISVTLPISGIISSFNLLPGTYVKMGQVIAVLENNDFIDMQQSYLDATAQVEFLEAQYNRQKSLADQDVTSQKSFQESKAQYLSAKSLKEAMKAKLSMLGISVKDIEKNGIVDKLEVKAAQSGYISEVMVNQGKFVNAGDAICQIINKSQILLNLIAYEKDLVKIKVGQNIQFKANGIDDEIFDAIITAIDQQVDPVNRSVKVYAKANLNQPEFRPGMYVVALIN